MKAEQTLSSLFSVRGSRFEVVLALLLLFSTSAFATVRYVDVNSTNATPPYTNWAAASTNIQLAVDVAAASGDEVVVMDGVYTNGGRTVGTNLLVNRVAVDKALTLRSVNGPQFTIIQGYPLPGTIFGDGAIRCAYLANGASLSGFTLTNGATRQTGPGGTPADLAGGGVWCESIAATVSNCVLAGNSSCSMGGGAYSGTLNSCLLSSNNTGGLPGGGYGGGAAYTTLNHCTLVGNCAHQNGGAADWCLLNNCTLRSNRSNFGDGARDSTLNDCVLSDHPSIGAENSTLNNCVLSNHVYVGAESCTLNNCTLVGNYCGASDSTLHNCIAYYNSGYNHWSSTLNYCCTTPLPPGVGNFTDAPLFVNYPGSNLRLQTNSPCINAGNNSFAIGTTDLDGNPRLVGGTVDMGAYECQSPALLDYFNWLQGYGLPTTASAVYADSDSDGLNNWQEWRADTNPTNALSALRMVTVTNGTPGLQVTWQSVPTRSYWLDRATNLASPPSFSSIASNLPGQVGTTSYTDTNALGPGPFFYRVGVGP